MRRRMAHFSFYSGKQCINAHKNALNKEFPPKQEAAKEIQMPTIIQQDAQNSQVPFFPYLTFLTSLPKRVKDKVGTENKITEN